MKTPKPPQLVPTEDLPSYFSDNGMSHRALGPLGLGFGHGNDQYQLYPYPAPADDETMGVFCEWHTADYFEVDTGPHVAIGMRGPLFEDPHLGRGLAIGILANKLIRREDPEHPVELFKGCPEPPGGPAFFIEDFTICDGTTAIKEWQLSLGQHLPQLLGNGIYRIDIHVSLSNVWAGVWEVSKSHSAGGVVTRGYTFLGQTGCSNHGPGPGGDPYPARRVDALDRGQGNAFIGTGFSDPETSSRIENIYIAHWKNPR